MCLSYKFQKKIPRDSTFLHLCFDFNNEDNCTLFPESINQAIIAFTHFAISFDYDNLLKSGYFIHQNIQKIDIKFYYQIFSYENFIILPTLIDILAKSETYAKNTDLACISLSLIYEISKSQDIDISILSTSSFFDCLFNFIIPHIIQKDHSHSFLPVLMLINQIVKDNPIATDNFFKECKFILKLVSIFEEKDTDHKLKICEIFIEILINHCELNFNYRESRINDDKESSTLILKKFIEDKMHDFENQPFYILDLITISLQKGFVDLRKLNIISSNSFINRKPSLREFNSLLNVISSAFSKKPQTSEDFEEIDEFISTFQWKFFSPFFSYIKTQSCKENFFFNDSLLVSLCNTFYLILKRSKLLAERSNNELNLQNILLSIASASDSSYKLKEASLQALNLFVNTEITNEYEFNMKNNYFSILLEFLESNSNDDFLLNIINSILKLIIDSIDEVHLRLLKRSQLSPKVDFKDQIQRNNSIYSLSDILLHRENDLREHIESALLNISMSNDECQKHLAILKDYSNYFYKLARNICDAKD